MRTYVHRLMPMLLLAALTAVSLRAAPPLAALTPDDTSTWTVVSGEAVVGNDAAEHVPFLTARGAEAIPVVLLSKTPITGAFVLLGYTPSSHCNIVESL